MVGGGGAGVGAVDPWADGQARLQGFKSEEDRQAWMVMLDSQDEGFMNYELHRNEVAVIGGRRAGTSIRAGRSYRTMDKCRTSVSWWPGPTRSRTRKINRAS